MEEDRQIPSRESYVDAVFGASGYLSEVFPGYTPRPGQVALAHAVDHAITERAHLLAEGPTGTGKSLAYAAPASYYAAVTGRPVVIVTANIALQEQIVSKDLPLLRRVVPWNFTYGLMKGRNNYLCPDRYYDTLSKGTPNDLSAEERRHLTVVQAWAKESIHEGPDHETGDVSELPFEPLPSIWRRFSVGADECKKKRCKSRDECFPNFALERARQSMVIVTNYHLLYAHLSVYLESEIDAVLPPFHVAILDEAHKAPDIARDFFGWRVTSGSVRRLARKLRSLEAMPEADAIERATTRYFHMLACIKRDQKRYKARLMGDFLPDEVEAGESMHAALGQGLERFRSISDRLTLELQELTDSGAGFSPEASKMGDALAEAELDLGRCDAVRASLSMAMHPAEQRRHVLFLEEDDRDGSVAVRSKLLHASDALTPGLFEKKVAPSGRRDDATPDIGAPVTVIATSATLATDGGSFDYITEELGVDSPDTLIAESPFVWPEQCLFIVPSGMPDPNDASFREAVARVVERTILLAGGRTLGLFTSRRSLEHTHDAVVGTCHRQKIRLLKQGDAPRTKLIETFQKDVSSVLLGTESFWAGVDVPGESLSVVVIDRLPFPTPDDPILDALAAHDDKWFFKYSIPRAIVQFRQGFGRLIRSLSCRGVVVCCDNRILSKRYGKQFLRALPDIPKSTRLEALAEWLNPAPAEAWDAT